LDAIFNKLDVKDFSSQPLHGHVATNASCELLQLLSDRNTSIAVVALLLMR
jgi:hypothetical protein